MAVGARPFPASWPQYTDCAAHCNGRQTCAIFVQCLPAEGRPGQILDRGAAGQGGKERLAASGTIYASFAANTERPGDGQKEATMNRRQFFGTLGLSVMGLALMKAFPSVAEARNGDGTGPDGRGPRPGSPCDGGSPRGNAPCGGQGWRRSPSGEDSRPRRDGRGYGPRDGSGNGYGRRDGSGPRHDAY